MSGMKRTLEVARDEGTDAFYAGTYRLSPYAAGSVQAEYWYEGFDYGQDMADQASAQITEEQIAQMDGYWEDFYAGERV